MNKVKTVGVKVRLNKTVFVAMAIASLPCIALAQTGKPDFAANVSKMDEAIKANPNDASARYYRAVALQNLGQYQRAKADYEWVSTHAKNATLVQYSTQALRNLTPHALPASHASAIAAPIPQHQGVPPINKAGATAKYSVMQQGGPNGER